MIFKLFFLGVIVVGSACLGNVLASSLEERLTALKSLANGVASLKNALIYQGMSLAEGLAFASRDGEIFDTCAKLIFSNPRASGGEIAQRAYKENKEVFANLTEDERIFFGELLERLSRAAVPEQIGEAVAIFSREIVSSINKASEEQHKRSRVIRSMCLLGGLAFAIIIV